MATATTASRVLLVGDVNPDLVLHGDVVPRFGQAEQLLDEAALVIGGSAGITAHAFARLGRAVSVVAAVGTDHLGDVVLDALTSAGVGTQTVVRRAGVPTGLSVVLSRGFDRAILTLPGTIPTLTADEVEAAIDATPDLRHVHVSALFLQPALAAQLPRVLAAAHARGVTTSLDTNDDPLGTWLGLDDLLPHVDVLLPNRSEVLALARQSDPHRAAARLAAAGPLVVVKDGADGAFATTPDGQLTTAPGHPRTPVDATGAGDTFDAAFLDSWLAQHPLARCLHRAVQAGALSVSAVGGTAGQPTRDDLDDLATAGMAHEH